MLVNFDIKDTININLTICSIKLDNIYGNIFCFPQKYPFIIEEMHINGIVSDKHIIGKSRACSFNK